jgi:glycosyltransferase involved in cell wall biosynthesis
MVSVVLPFHNQADHAEAVVLGFRSALQGAGVEAEFVLVPNACTDATAEICTGLAEAHADVEAVVLEEGGWGRAVRAGLDRARGSLLCYTNSARTTAEMLVLAVVYARSYPGAVVKAHRRIRDSWVRRAGSLLYNLECRVLHDLAVWDVNGTPKVFPRSCEALLALRRDDDLIDLEFNLVCRDMGYPVVEVPILATVRHGGRSTTNWRAGWRMYRGAWELRGGA